MGSSGYLIPRHSSPYQVFDAFIQSGNRVIPDIEQEALARSAIELEDSGASVLAVQTDVSDHNEVEVLVQKTIDRFGAVHLLFNNAGFVVGGAIWEQSLAD